MTWVPKAYNKKERHDSKIMVCYVSYVAMQHTFAEQVRSPLTIELTVLLFSSESASVYFGAALLTQQLFEEGMVTPSA